jgi:HNH endonuclease
VFVGYETFAGRICELADGTVVTPGSLVPWLPDGWVERAVFDGPDRVVSLGQRRRLFTGALRRAVQIQGRECFHEYCDQPADHTQIDHIQPYAAGGATTIDNGRPACAYHNRWRHQLAQPP